MSAGRTHGTMRCGVSHWCGGLEDSECVDGASHAPFIVKQKLEWLTGERVKSWKGSMLGAFHYKTGEAEVRNH